MSTASLHNYGYQFRRLSTDRRDDNFIQGIREQHGVARGKPLTAAVAACNLHLSRYADKDAETAGAFHVDRHRCLHTHKFRHKLVATLNQRRALTVKFKMSFIVVIFIEIDCLKGKVGVQFALLAVFVDTVKVIDAVCYVARLLYPILCTRPAGR